MVRTISESQKLNHMHERAIIISASGMCEAGRILHHLKNGISRPNNTVIFVGYCAANTLGRRIMNGAQEVRILGDLFPVRARIKSLDSFSGHADHNELLSYFRATGGSKSRVFLVHGEKECSAAMHEALQKEHAGSIEIARLNTTVSC
jgi:metallo-beta-lactamase family protein